MSVPGFDGTGPRGYGPVTGGGLGFCLLKMPDTVNEPITGFAGLSGRPVACFQNRPETELFSLRADVYRFQMMVDELKRRISMAEKNRMTTTWFNWKS